jgi:iron complex outermembrane receptor protein
METSRRIPRPRARLLLFTLAAAAAFSGRAAAQQIESAADAGAPASPSPAARPMDDGELVILEAFEVSSKADIGYYSGNTASATRLDTPINETASSIYVINRELIRDIAAADLAEMITYAPEMALGESGDNRLGMTMRGNDVGDPLINGVSRNTRGTISSMANIERAEIVAGPTSIFLANDVGIGGGINLSTKKPNFTRPVGSIDFQLKSGATSRFVYDYGRPAAPGSRWAWRVVVEGIEGKAEDGFIEEFAVKKRIGLMPSLGYRTKRTSLFLFGEIFYQKTNRPKGADLVRNNQIIQVPVDVNVNSGYDTMQRNQASLQAILMHALSAHWAVRGVAMATYNDNMKNTMNLNGNSDWGYANLASGGLIGWARTFIEEYHEIRENYAFQVDLAGTFDTGPLRHQLVIGADLKYNSSKQDYAHALFPADQQLFDIYHPDYNITPDPKFPHRRINSRGTRTNVYINENIKALRDRVILNLGLRASDFTQSNDRLWYYPNPRPPHIGFPSKWEILPRAGLVVKIVEPVSLYYGYSETYIPRTDYVNPDGSILDPETGVQHEAGVKALLFKGRVILNTSVYNLQKEHVAERDDVRSSPGVDYYNSDRAIRIRGWNLKLTLNPLSGLQLNGSLTAIDPEINKVNTSGQDWQIGKSPKNEAKLRYNWSARYEFRKGTLRGFTTGVFGTHVGEKPADLRNDGVDAFVNPAWDRYDVFARYARKKWSLQLNVSNIFDKRFYPYIDYYRDGGAGTARRAPPREFTLTYHRDF